MQRLTEPVGLRRLSRGRDFCLKSDRIRALQAYDQQRSHVLECIMEKREWNRLTRMDSPYSEPLYNSIIVLLKVVCDIVHLAAHYGLYVCILRREIGERVSERHNRVARGGKNTRLPLLGQTAAFERQCCEALGHGAAGLRAGMKRLKSVSAQLW